MSEHKSSEGMLRPAGYAALTKRYGLDAISNWHRSYVATSGTHRIDSTGNEIEEIYPSKYWPGDSLGDHLEFALKYDGTNLALLATLFHVADPNEILRFIQSKPTGKYARRLWFLYEFLTDQTLPLDNLKQGNYIDLLDPEEYCTITPARRIQRQFIRNNLIGDAKFCPTIRRTERLRDFETADLPTRCAQALSSYPPELLKRALSYLYTKETKSSFEIEHIKPSSTRTERFVAFLQRAEQEDFCEKRRLIDLQNSIVDERYRDEDYRTSQNYIGEAVAWQNERIHYVCPKPEDIHDLMAGLIGSHQRMKKTTISPVVHATAIAYGFVFLHPFEDGNGRIHRLLIHNILAQRDFTPEGIMFPVSASMLKNSAAYDASLEAFSRPLMALMEYSLDPDGRMTVQGNVANWYRYIDMTSQVEALYHFIEQTIDIELVEELGFLASYDETKSALQGIVDMPDRQIDLFIRFCLQNHGHLSVRKRASHFDILSDDEVSRMEVAVQSAYGTDGSSDDPLRQ